MSTRQRRAAEALGHRQVRHSGPPVQTFRPVTDTNLFLGYSG